MFSQEKNWWIKFRSDWTSLRFLHKNNESRRNYGMVDVITPVYEISANHHKMFLSLKFSKSGNHIWHSGIEKIL